MKKNPPSEALDDIDLRLMRYLQDDGRLSNAKLAQRVALSETPCWHRLRKLETEGYIQGYQAMLDRRKLGLGELAFISLNFSPHTEEAFAALEKLVETNGQVLTCHRVTGEADFVMMVVAQDLDSVREFIDTVLRTLPNVATVRTSLSLREVKFSGRLPV